MSETRARILCGKKISRKILDSIAADIVQINTFSTFTPTLSVMQVGNNDSNTLYLRAIETAATRCGVVIRQILLSRDATTEEILQKILFLNRDSSVHGIIFHLPIDSSHPHHIQALLNAIHPDKDVDGMTQVQKSRFLRGEFLESHSGNLTHVPCAAAACFHLLQHTGKKLNTKRCVILGRGRLVGKPLFHLLMRATSLRLSICHKRTRHFPEQVARGDVVFACLGVPQAVKGDWIRPGAVVIDCGAHTIPDDPPNSNRTKLSGDVEFGKAVSRASWITPVPGGVGPVTVSMLIRNTLASAKWFRASIAQ